MITLKKGLLISLALALAAGCSNAGTETKDSSISTASNANAMSAETNYTEITWEDLMPEGEDEVLETLYLEFYEEFERKMKQSSMTLGLLRLIRLFSSRQTPQQKYSILKILFG